VTLRPVELDEAIKDSRRRLGLGIGGRYDLGILLVHGLGEQGRGDTLTEQGDRLIQWLRRRVGSHEGDRGPKVHLLDVAARQRSTDAIPSAHAVVRITPRAGSGTPETTGEPAHWVVAESFWADVFRPATFGEMAGWCVTAGPWVFATQVAGMRRRMEIGERVPRLLRLALIPITLIAGAVLLFVAALAGFLVTVLAVAALLLALTRIPLLADAARAVQRNLASSLGDAYVLVRSPVRFGAMASQVRADLGSLRRTCSAVVVIAESQGTAVAWYALKHELSEPGDDHESGTEKRAPIGLFLTHGQALRKLTFALTMARGSQTGRQTLAALSSAALLGGGLVAFLAGAPWPLTLVLLLLAIIAESILLASAIHIWRESGRDIEDHWKTMLQADGTSDSAEPQLEWLDLWASADPFALGPLDVVGERISSYKIRNLGSTTGDHVGYWKNTTEFLPIVTSRLFGLGGQQLQVYAEPLSDPRLLVAAMRRHARVLLLLLSRTFVGVGVVAGLGYALQRPEFGARVIEFVSALNLPLIDDFFDAPPEWAVFLAGFVLVVALAGIAWTLVSHAWNVLMRTDETTYFSGISRPLWTWPWYAFGALVVPIAGLVATLLWIADGPTLAIAYLIGSIFAALLALTVLSGGGTTFAGAETGERTMAAARRITGRTESSLAITVVVASILVVVPAAAALLAPAAVAWILAAEIVLLSVVLAVEGVREYRLFEAAFNAQNAQLPGPEPRPDAEAH